MSLDVQMRTALNTHVNPLDTVSNASNILASISPYTGTPSTLAGKVSRRSADQCLQAVSDQKVVNFRDVSTIVNTGQSGLRFKPNMLMRGGHLRSISSGMDMNNPSIIVNLTQDVDKLPSHHQPHQLKHLPPPQKSEFYDLTNKNNQTWLHRVIQAIAVEQTPGPILIHCNAGKDRTGLVVAALLKTLDVDDQTILQDYLLSHGELSPKKFEQALTHLQTISQRITPQEKQHLHERFLSATPADFSNASLVANCDYQFGDLIWSTDELGRVNEVRGTVHQETVLAITEDPVESSVKAAYGQELSSGHLQDKALLVVPALGGPIKHFNFITLSPQAKEKHTQMNKKLRAFAQNLGTGTPLSISKIITYNKDSNKPTAIHLEYGAEDQPEPVKASINCG